MAYQPPSVSQLYDKANLDCNIPTAAGIASPFAGDFTYHRILEVLAGFSTILCCILSFGQISDHLLHFANSVEQKQIVRVILTVPLFAIFGFFQLWFYHAAWYIQPIPTLYECFALIALFYHLVHYAVPRESGPHDVIAALEKVARSTDQQNSATRDIQWFYFNWILIFQLLPGRIATTIAREVVEATFCPLAHKTFNARTIISCVEGAQVLVCLGAIIRVYSHLRAGHHFQGHRIISKMSSLKGIVFIQLIQNSIIAGLAEKEHLKPETHVSFLDLWIGTVSFLTCVESVVFAGWMLQSFSAGPYRMADTEAISVTPVAEGQRSQVQSSSRKHYGFGRALLEVLNIWDIISGTWVIFDVIVGHGQSPFKHGKSEEKKMQKKHGLPTLIRGQLHSGKSEV